MANFFVDKSEIEKDIALIMGDEASHIIKTLRMGVGDFLTLFDGEGGCADAVIESVSQKEVLAKIIERYSSETEPRLKITLFQGIPKNPKMDLIVQKATEIGVCEIVPVKTKRVIVKGDKDSKTERLRRIAFEAAKQCGRAFVPHVADPLSFDDALKKAKECDRVIIPYECEKEGKLSGSLFENVNSVAIFIGPEGGFEESEVEKALSYGAKKVTLGKRILRTETAGLITSAICLYVAGDMG